MRLLLYIVLLLLPSVVWGQGHADWDNTYKPFDCGEGFFSEYIELTQQRYYQDLTTLKGKPKTHRTDLTAMYTERYESLKYKYDKQHFYSDTVVTAYFQNILNTILKANPQLPTDVRLLVARYPWANASCYGEGTIVFNLDLVAWLEDESQIAFVLCHELAHYQANHVNQGMDDYVAALYDPEMQKKLKQIYYSGYNTYEQAMALLKNFAYSDRKHSRLHESEADSMAVLLMRNTRYSEEGALSALKQLDKVDGMQYDTLPWHNIFNFGAYPFKNSWLEQESGLSSFGKSKVKDVDGLDSDSLKTHPDCVHRIALLESQIIRNAQKKAFVQPQEKFAMLNIAARFEQVRNVFFFENYGKTLFLATDLLQRYPNNTYLLGMVGQCWYSLYKAQEKHVFGKYTGLPGATEIYSYNQLLILLNNLRLTEMGKIGFHYLNQHRYKAAQDEELLYSLMQFSKIEGNMELYVSLQTQYKKTYPEGKYITQL